MAPVGYSSSTLEDTHAGVATGGQAGPNFFWPVFRYGRILVPEGGNSLRVSDAQEIGSLFEPGGPAARRYREVRTPELRKEVELFGGRYHREWPGFLNYGSAPFKDLKRHWNPDAIVITYSFVPIVRLPRFVVEIGDSAWQVRESLTVCGAPSRSKAWVTASLVTCNGRPADASPLSRSELDGARSHLHRLAQVALDSLIRYYQQVLNEDAACLPLTKRPRISGFEVVTETEIVSLASGVDLGQAFDLLERDGFGRFRREAPENPTPGNREVLDFLEWAESHGSIDGGHWSEGSPKMLVIYADDPSCGSVRALMVPRIDAENDRTWYALLSEKLRPERPVTCYPLSEAAGRFFATEYGRYF